MKNKIKLFIVISIILIGAFLYFNTGLKELEKYVSKFDLPENVEKIAMKSKIGDSGGNGEYSTYRVVLVVKTEMSLYELERKFANRNLTSSTHLLGSNTPICYITSCENKVFQSSRSFTLNFEELEKIEDFSNYYFIEFIK